MERTSKKKSKERNILNSFSHGWLRSVGCSLVATVILFVATETQLLDKSIMAKWAALMIGVGLFIYFGLPLVLLGSIYLTLGKIAWIEYWIRKHLLRKFPDSHYLRTMFDPSYHRETLFAVTAFVWSKDHPNQLLWVKNKTHNRWLPPGGRLLANELPHVAIKEKVCSETGTPEQKLNFCKLFHTINDAHIAEDENVEPVPIPIMIQKEVLEQRGGIPYHYDFFYVLETDYTGGLIGEQGPQWRGIEAVEKSREDERPFPNVCFLARLVLEKVKSVQS